MMGETGPMGPCSEIHFTSDPSRRLPDSSSPAAAWDGWLEIWNLVFMQFERREAGGELFRLPAPSIDTGAGLERMTSVLQGVSSNYHTDLFEPLLDEAAAASGKRYGASDSDDVSMQVIADHARTSAFLIADGVFPDKTGREYVLRRIFRRAVRHGKLLGIDEPFMHRVCARVVTEMGDVFPELRERASVIEQVALEEEKGFRRTLERGLGMLEDEFERLRGTGADTVAGPTVFQLYDTFGFPEDLTEIIAGEHGFKVDKAGFERAMDAAKQQSKFESGTEAVEGLYKALAAEHRKSEFVGYETTEAPGRLVGLVDLGRGDKIDRAVAGTRVALVCDRTPFYAEAGGQTGDSGEARGPNGRVRIEDTKKPAGDTFVHFGEVVEGTVAVGETLELAADAVRRDRIRANHSATHLLHLALKKVLGPHVAQKGSLVLPDRLRFDFTHFSPMTDEQKRAVEDLVNAEILRNVDSRTEVLAYAEAKERGAVAMFGEKYGDVVRVVNIGSESLEFCGGTHVRRTGDIGLCKILSESSVAQGVRRLEAVTGIGAMDYLRRVEDELAAASARLRSTPFEVADRIARMQADAKQLEKELAELKGKLASGGSRDLMSEVIDVDGVKVLAVSTEIADAKTLRETGDKLRDRLGSGVLLLAGIEADKVSLLAMVTKDLTKRFHAGNLLKAVAEILDGRGGGRPDMAQGGGKDPSKVPQALAHAVELVRAAARAAH
jgi:alanyl-tRNA synthetase